MWWGGWVWGNCKRYLSHVGGHPKGVTVFGGDGFDEAAIEGNGDDDQGYDAEDDERQLPGGDDHDGRVEEELDETPDEHADRGRRDVLEGGFVMC